MQGRPPFTLPSLTRELLQAGPLRAFASRQDRSARSLANLSQNLPTTIPQAPPSLGICGQGDSYN
eukprot:scaffold7219_cov129-Isochrysis_galbana.AAC.4